MKGNNKWNLKTTPLIVNNEFPEGTTAVWYCAFFLLTQVLICRNYKGDVDMAEIDHFLPLLMQHEEEGLLCPVLSHGSVHFMWIKHTNLYCILF